MSEIAFDPIFRLAEPLLMEVIIRADRILGGRLDWAVDFSDVKIYSSSYELFVSIGPSNDGTLRFARYDDDWRLLDFIYPWCSFNVKKLEIALDRLKKHMVLEDLADV